MKVSLAAVAVAVSLSAAVPAAAQAVSPAPSASHAVVSSHVAKKASVVKKVRGQAVAAGARVVAQSSMPRTKSAASKVVAGTLKSGFSLVQYRYHRAASNGPAGFQLCVAHTSGAWAVYDSNAGAVTRSGSSGVGCLVAPPPPSH